MVPFLGKEYRRAIRKFVKSRARGK
jgi:hypothetical protein